MDKGKIARRGFDKEAESKGRAFLRRQAVDW